MGELVYCFGWVCRFLCFGWVCFVGIVGYYECCFCVGGWCFVYCCSIFVLGGVWWVVVFEYFGVVLFIGC